MQVDVVLEMCQMPHNLKLQKKKPLILLQKPQVQITIQVYRKWQVDPRQWRMHICQPVQDGSAVV